MSNSDQISKRARMSSISSGMFTASGQHFGSSMARARPVPEPALPGFNLQEYLSKYKGYAKIRRAIFAGERCNSLSVESYMVALREVEENTYDSTTYMHLSKLLEQLTRESAGSKEWAGRVNKEAKDQDTEIRAKLERAKKQVSKKDSLEAQKQYVGLLQKRGLMDESVRALQDGRNFCTGIDDQAQLHMEAARVSQVMGRWLQVVTYIQRTESVLPELPEHLKAEVDVMRAQADFGDCKWEVAVGQLQGLSYDEAARVFENGVVLPRDIALYGTLAGLAALERDDVKRKLLDNARFGQFLDRMPVCQKLIQYYCSAKYGDALSCLDQIMSFCLLDPVIGPHVSLLEQRIKDNIVILYIQPFVSVRLTNMAEALRFGSVKELENTLVRMIDGKQIPARIDGTAGFLVKHTVDARDAALSRVEDIHRAFTLQSELMTARIQYLEEESVRKHSRHA